MLEITPIKAFNDNYLWLFKPSNSKQAVIVDPGDAEVVEQYLDANDLELSAIFITHHHGDHTGGIDQLVKRFNIPVYGPKSNNIPSITNPLIENDQVDIFGITFHVKEIPGHTMDHIAYYTAEAVSAEGPVLFCGDTLFAGGCGRVFEGTYEMMHDSLQKLASLSPNTQVYCAHEYTMANLAFATAVSPVDQVLAKRVQKEQEKRNQNLATVPTSIARELSSNPFLRCNETSINMAASSHAQQQLSQPHQVFASLRKWKDSF